MNNIGISGQTQATINTLGASYDAIFATGNNRNVIVNNAGTNDLSNGTTGADLWALMLTWINARKTAGLSGCY